MPKIDFDLAVENCVARDPRYAPDAYALVRDSLQDTFKELSRQRGSDAGHLRGPEILTGFRTYVLRQFGPMVPTLLEAWGIRSTRDVGEIVFHLIEENVYSRSEEDRIEDFVNVFDFSEAFEKPFLPSGKTQPTVK